MMLIAGIELAEGNSKRGRPTPPDVADVAGTAGPASVASGGESVIPDGGLAAAEEGVADVAASTDAAPPGFQASAWTST